MAKKFKYDADGERVFTADGEPEYEDDALAQPVIAETKPAVKETQFQRQKRITEKRLEQYGTSIDSLANVHGLSPSLIKAVASIESTGRQRDDTGKTMRSPAGALGMMQLMPPTAAEMGVDPHNDRENLSGGAGYLKKMMDRFGGDTDKGLAAYNAGAGTVFRLLKKHGPQWKDHLPEETKNYLVNARQYFDAYGGVNAPEQDILTVSQEDLMGKRYQNPNFDPKISKANLLFDDKEQQDREIQRAQKRGFKDNSKMDRFLAGAGRWAYGLPGVGQAYNKLTKTGTTVADEDAVYRRATKGPGPEDLGELAPDIAMLAAGGAGAAKLFRNLYAKGAASSVPSIAVHQGQNVSRGQGVDPVSAGLEATISTLATPGGVKLSKYFTEKAPDILQKAVSSTFAEMDQVNPPDFSEALAQKLVPYFGGTRGLESKIAPVIKRQGEARAVAADVASKVPGTNQVRRAVNVQRGVLPTVRKELDEMMKNPKSKLIPEVRAEAEEALKYWSEQFKGRATQKGGWGSVEDAVGFRQAVDDQVNFRESNKTMTKGFQLTSSILRKRLNDYVRAKAPDVAAQTDEMAKLQPLLLALQRRNIKNPSFLTPFDYSGMGAAAGLSVMAPGVLPKAVAPAVAAASIGLRKLSSTVGGAAMLSDLGGSLGRRSAARDATAQSVRSSINKMRDN